MDDERARRIGVNEALFRAVNEQIEGLNKRLEERGAMEVVCECGDGQCVERLPISMDDYERVRKDPRRFVIAPGHDIPDVETVLERHDAFHIVEKIHPEPERIAEETDPRS
jgi:hypothetical protein